MQIFRIKFQYFSEELGTCEATLHGRTKQQAYDKAADFADKFGDGGYSTIELYDILEEECV